MARKQARPQPLQHVTLAPLQTICRACGCHMWMGHHSHRTVTTLQGVTRLTLKVYRCRNAECSRFHQSTRPEEVANLCRAWEIPIKGVITDGQHSIRNAVASALPGIPHQLCHFHYLREAAKPIADADRHAKKELKKHVRGVRPIERSLEGRTDEEAEAVRGYCLAVRSALTDDGRPPLDADGLKLRKRLQDISDSIACVEQKESCPTNSAVFNSSCKQD